MYLLSPALPAVKKRSFAMSICKCKMCEGELTPEPFGALARCDTCGAEQTLPTGNDERKLTLFQRANKLRLSNEYEKAAVAYRKLASEFPLEAEAFWGLCLCKYGVEYASVPGTGNRLPTFHRLFTDTIAMDPDYKTVLENADAATRRVYETEAAKIDMLQQRILDAAKTEPPYDVFLCCKETDESGNRTTDSLLSRSIYDQLTAEGISVFYPAATLADKAATAHEPCVYSALHTARVMLVIGTRPEYFNDAQVKSEWIRFSELMKTDKKKLMIPCYKYMSDLDLPEEFAALQTLDMSRNGFMKGVVMGIHKMKADADAEKAPPAVDAAPEYTGQTQEKLDAAPTPQSVSPLINSGFLALDNGDFARAYSFFEQARTADATNGYAYFGLLMAGCKARRREDLARLPQPFDGDPNYGKAMLFGNDDIKRALTDALAAIRQRTATYPQSAPPLNGPVDAPRPLQPGPAGADVRTNAPAENEAQKKNSRVLIGVIAGAAAVVLAVGFLILYLTVISPNRSYNEALRLMEKQEYSAAIEAFEKLNGYKDSKEKIAECEKAAVEADYNKALRLMEEKKYDEAIAAFKALGDYKDSAEKIKQCETEKTIASYAAAVRLLDEKRYDEAYAAFTALGDYKDSKEKAEQCLASKKNAADEDIYTAAEAMMADGKYAEAYEELMKIPEYTNAKEKAREAAYKNAQKLSSEKNYLSAIDYYEKSEKYLDSEKQILENKYSYVIANQNNADANVSAFVAQLKAAGRRLITAADVTDVTGGSTSSTHFHLFTEGATVTPTCSEEGYTSYACTCGATAKGNKTEKTPHDFTGGDCMHHAVCSVCGQESAEFGDHRLGDWVCDSEVPGGPEAARYSEYHVKVCEVCNQIIEREKHDQNGISCSEFVHYPCCSVCGRFYWQAGEEHTFDENGVCTVCGYKKDE